MRVLKTILGAILGIVIGLIGGFIATGLQLSRKYPGQLIGISPAGLARTPIFWAVLLPSVVGFTFLFSRIGRSKHASQV